MAKFRKKATVIIDAVRWDGKNVGELTQFMGVLSINFGDVMIRTLEGDMRAREGDWIIRGVQGEFYPCKPDIFEETYEAV